MGEARLRGATWEVRAEPHVITRLKRVFPRAYDSVRGAMTLGDTDEVCRDLLWVAERWPLEILPRAHAEARASRHVETERLFAAIVSGATAPRTFETALPLRDYQRVAAELALRSGGLLIADDLGVGKTASAIGALVDGAARPALVVTMTHLVTQWTRELARFAPQLRVHALKTGKPYPLLPAPRRGQLELIAPEFPDVVVCNYQKLHGWAETLAGNVRGIVFDEVQELRRADSKKADAARALAEPCAVRIGLSATPFYNYGGELFNVLDVLRPDALGSRPEFLREWCVGFDDKAKFRDPAAFGRYARESGLMLRRTRADVRRELPPLQIVSQTVDCDTAALDAAEDKAAELARILLDRTASVFARRDAAGEMDWRLRQATGIAKAPFVAEFVRLLVESGEQVLLFGWHHQVYDLWRERLANLGVAVYTGQESPKQKDEARRRFIEGEVRVLIMSLRSGAGLDGLQHACRTVVFGELDWSPAVHEQCIGRPHRDGQTDPVSAYFLVAESGSDPVIADVLGIKQGQIDGLKDPDAALVEKLQVDEDRMRKLAEALLAKRGKPAPCSNVIQPKGTS